jgi:hypothetical protein
MPAKSHPKKRVLFRGNLLTHLLAKRDVPLVWATATSSSAFIEAAGVPPSHVCSDHYNTPSKLARFSFKGTAW